MAAPIGSNRCKAEVQTSKDNCRLISDIRWQGIDSPQSCLPVIEASSARTAAGLSLPVVPPCSVDWNVRARLATMDHCGVRRALSDLRLLRDLEWNTRLCVSAMPGKSQLRPAQVFALCSCCSFHSPLPLRIPRLVLAVWFTCRSSTGSRRVSPQGRT